MPNHTFSVGSKPEYHSAKSVKTKKSDLDGYFNLMGTPVISKEDGGIEKIPSTMNENEKMSKLINNRLHFIYNHLPKLRK